MDTYFKKVLIKDLLIRTQNDVVKAMDLAQSFVKESQSGTATIIAGRINELASTTEKDFKNLNDSIDDLFEEIEIKQRQRRQGKVFAT